MGFFVVAVFWRFLVVGVFLRGSQFLEDCGGKIEIPERALHEPRQWAANIFCCRDFSLAKKGKKGKTTTTPSKKTLINQKPK